MDANSEAAISIRRALPGDIPLLAALGQQAYRQHFSYLWTPEGLEQYLADAYPSSFFQKIVADPQTIIWLVDYQQQPSGYLIYFRRKQLPGHPEMGAYINRLYLLKNRIGLGLGSRLMALALSQAQQEGCAHVWLEVMQSNPESIAFYQKHGFKIYGETAFTRFEMRTPELARMWWMTRRIEG